MEHALFFLFSFLCFNSDCSCVCCHWPVVSSNVVVMKNDNKMNFTTFRVTIRLAENSVSVNSVITAGVCPHTKVFSLPGQDCGYCSCNNVSLSPFLKD